MPAARRCPASTAPTNTAMPRPAWTTFAEPLALNSCTSGAKRSSEKSIRDHIRGGALLLAADEG